MKIDRVSTARSATVKRNEKNGAAGGARFADNLADEVPVNEAVGGGAIGPVEALLALQEVPDAAQGRKRRVKHAESLLDGLEEIHLSLVMGTVSEQRLLTLRRQLSESRPNSSDPALEALVTQVEIRVEVELAKRGL